MRFSPGARDSTEPCSRKIGRIGGLLFHQSLDPRPSSRNLMAGEEGFEPSYGGIKIRCLNQLGDSPSAKPAPTTPPADDCPARARRTLASPPASSIHPTPPPPRPTIPA